MAESVESVHEALSAMEELGLVLCVHAEDPEAPVLDREVAFLPIVKDICEAWPRLRIVVEHLSCAASVEWIAGMPDRVGATITAIIWHTAWKISWAKA
jgi:dihydroorotase